MKDAEVNNRSRSEKEESPSPSAEQEKAFRSMMEEESLAFEGFLKRKREELDELRQMLRGESGEKLVRELSDELDSMSQLSRSRFDSCAEPRKDRRAAEESRRTE